MTSPPAPAPAWLRLLSALLYAAFAALGAGLLARPALLAFRSAGLFGPVVPWEVPLGGLFVLLFLLVALCTVRLTTAAALGQRLLQGERLLLLGLSAAALVLRALAGEPQAPTSPEPQLLEAVRLLAARLDAAYAVHTAYPRDAAGLQEALAPLGPSAFVLRARPLPLRVVTLGGQDTAQLEPLPGDGPGTLYAAISADQSRAALSVLSLTEGRVAPLRLFGRPLVVKAQAGTHHSPGRDPLLPDYPGMEHAVR